MNTVERQRRRIVRTFLLANLAQDVALFIGSIGAAIQNFGGNANNTIAFLKYDQARKYRDLTGGDFGEAVGCPGHFTGDCQHADRGEDEE